MKNAKSTKSGLDRKHFLSILGKSALGLWVLQLVPSSLAHLPRRKKAQKPNPLARSVKAHPQAVERNQRG